VLEDTEAGVASAKAAGMRCIAVGRTLAPDRLAAADEIVPGVDEALIDRILV
jgi:beta-phosphoglucomutase-like phosphatase (HAD superfamily)